MIPPTKPFDHYKWRWAEYTPIESLNVPPVFLGVLRALRAAEGRRPTDASFIDALDRVRNQTGSPVDLARRNRPDRNIIRYAGRYWKALGLLEGTQPIELTPFGRRVADRRVTRDEFAAATIKTLELPNRRIEDDTSDWDGAGLSIRPLSLIMGILEELSSRLGNAEAYLTLAELVRVVIPLSGSSAPLWEYVQALRYYRRGALDMTRWPNCTQRPNDGRMAHEFLLFLYHYNFVARTGSSKNNFRYYLPASTVSSVAEFNASEIGVDSPETAVDELRTGSAAELVPRQVITTAVIARPQQGRFRRDILAASGCRCAITGEELPDVLEAAHLIPVEEGGSDLPGNGLCLRVDIHRLIDAGHIRVRPNGKLEFSEQMDNAVSYADLPESITVPNHVDRECLRWRWEYE
jgi:hypothetical protein